MAAQPKQFESWCYLRRGFVDFYRFSPPKLCTVFVLMLLQRTTAGVGLLLILPLLENLGLSTGQASQISDGMAAAFDWLGVPQTLPIVLAIFLFVVTTVSGIQYYLTTLSTELKQAYTHRLRLHLYDLVLHARWLFISERKVSDFNHVLSIQVQAISHATHLLLNSMAALTTLMVMLVLALVLSWSMTLLAIGTAGVLIMLLWPMYRKSYASGATQLFNFKAIFQNLSEQLASLKTVKSHANEDKYLQDIDSISQQLEAQNSVLTRMNATTSLVYTVGAAIAFSLLLWLSQVWLDLPLATLIILLVLYARIMPQVSRLQSNLQQLIHMVPAFQDVFQMRQQCQAVQEPRLGGSPLQFNRALSLKGVSFQYPRGEHPVFENINLELNKGETLLITGESGSGKSTLVDIIVGLLPPCGGQIFSDDQVIDANNAVAWRKNISYVTQEVFLFHDTVKNNLIRLLDTEPTEPEIWQALELAAAKDFVQSLPDGLDTFVGDRGIKLSGGERQRIALARAILMKPELLILDEATSALDQENELKIQQAIANLHGQLTIIVISHRPNHHFEFDQHIRLERASFLF